MEIYVDKRRDCSGDGVIWGLVFINLPREVAWDIVALLVGIDMVVGGAALIFMMLYARNAAD